MSVALNSEQRDAVAAWIGNGDSLSSVQQRIKDDFGLSLTYMDVRFLVIELGVAVKDRERAKAPAPPMGGDEAGLPDGAFDDGGDAGAGVLPEGAGAVRLEMDRIMKPGSVISGSVVFSDGVRAAWILDKLGRLALDAGQPGYAPPEADIPVFQDELRKLLSRQGF